MLRIAALIIICFLCQILEAQPLKLSGGETQSAIIVDVETGKTIYSYNQSLWVTPASLTKLFTTAAAIEQFSPEAKITTSAYLDESNNNIIIYGHADPTFNSRYFIWHKVESFANDIADALKVKHIEGINQLILNTGFVEGPQYPSKRLWEDMGNYFGAAPCAFNCIDNTSEIILASPQRVGEQCEIVSVNSPIAKKPLCFVKSYSRNADSVYVYGTSTDDWYVSGAMPTSKSAFKVKSALISPEKYFALLIVKQLNKRGINVSEIIYESKYQKQSDKPLCVSKSPTIEAISQNTNHESNNLFADALMLQLGGTPTSWDKGIAALRQYVASKTGLEPRLYDGSGLSPMGKATVEQFVKILIHMHKSKYAEQYERTLAIAGISGTLKTFGKAAA